MNNSFADESKKAIAYLKEVTFGLLFGNSLAWLDNGGEIAIA